MVLAAPRGRQQGDLDVDNREMMGEACAANADCGNVGNLCIRNSRTTPRYCTAACTDTSGCPDGWSCRQIASTSTQTIYGNACVRN